MSRSGDAYIGEQPMLGRYDAADAAWEGAKRGYADRVLAEALASAKTGDGHCAILKEGLKSPHWRAVRDCPLWQFIPGMDSRPVKCAETSTNTFVEAQFWEGYVKAYPDCLWGSLVAEGTAVRDLPGYTSRAGAAWRDQVAAARAQFTAGKRITNPTARETLPDTRFAALAGLHLG